MNLNHSIWLCNKSIATFDHVSILWSILFYNWVYLYLFNLIFFQFYIPCINSKTNLWFNFNYIYRNNILFIVIFNLIMFWVLKIVSVWNFYNLVNWGFYKTWSKKTGKTLVTKIVLQSYWIFYKKIWFVRSFQKDFPWIFPVFLLISLNINIFKGHP